MRSFAGRDVIAIEDFEKEELLYLLSRIGQIKHYPAHPLKQSRILGSCFYEPSTRTRLSFEAAMHRMGGKVVGFSSAEHTSGAKGESLVDTMKMLEAYADVVVLRHPEEGAARLAAQAIGIPVINAGDGAHQHPTQTFLDLFSIQECQGRLEGLHIAFAGDLKYGRTVHSLVQALRHFHCTFYFVPHGNLELPQEIAEKIGSYTVHKTLEEILPRLDLLYMTRIQKERLGETERAAETAPFALHASHLCSVKPNLRVLHPLPRLTEIDPSVDATPHAYYFQQAQNGLYTRQAVLGLVLGEW